ncbi:MAG: GTPase ObgE [Cytophagales bacterium]|nr:MAG: GTPase ObgE [Cytophagales bacterium]
MTSNFIDYVKIQCRSGKGGAGSVHFRREKFVAKGGPDGGDGGRGGHIILKGNAQLWTLLHLKYQKHIFADDGEGGSGAGSSGAQGKDAIIEVPIGTIARWADKDDQPIFAEITHDKQEIVLLSGGRGGLGNRNFKSATRQAPQFAQPGEPSITEWVILELKLLADVGLVGFPNAGKSTLLSVVSAAKPEIADYPFTTLVPNLGVVQYRDYQSFVMADIPGLIEGAAEGKGLGIRFLRHIERNSILLFLLSAESEHIDQDYKTLLYELEKYNPTLLHKQRLIAVSKMDIVTDDAHKKRLIKQLPKEIPHIMISSITQQGILELKDLIMQTLQKQI